MSPLMRSECRKFAPNIFNKTKCTNCFRQKEEHSAEALESNRATRKVCKCGYLFVAPDWDFSNPINRTKRWQRRWFILYDDGELTYSVDEHPDTVPQAVISLLSSSGQGGGSIVWEALESDTGHPHSLAIAAPDRIHFVRGDTKDETRAWLSSLLAVASPLGTQGNIRIRQARHKRNATFPGGRSNPLPMGVPQRVISGTTAVSQQHSPVLRQRFNSCISPLHHDLPSEVDEKDYGSIQHFHSSAVCKTSASVSLSGCSSTSPVKKNPDASPSTPSNVTNEDSLLLRPIISGTDSSSLFFKEVDTSDGFIKATQFYSPKSRLFSDNTEAEQDIKEAPITKSIQNNDATSRSESTKFSPTVPWKRYSSFTSERQASTALSSEKNVRGDPDGCVLETVSISCCSVEEDVHIGRLLPKQLANTVNESNERRSIKDAEEPTSKKDLPWKHTVVQEATKHGWLMKLGNSKEWSKHWFVLHGAGLLYYRDPSAEGIGILDGVIDLGLVHDVREAEVERNHGLQLTTWDGKQYTLSAITPGIRTGWMEALRKAAGLSCVLQRKSSPKLLEKYNDMLGTAVISERLGQPHNISEVLSQSDTVLADPSELMSVISKSTIQTTLIGSKEDAEEMVQSCGESPFTNSSALELSSSQANKKYENDLIDNRLGNSLCDAQFNSNFSSRSAQKADSLLRETYCSSESAVLGNSEIILNAKESQDKCYVAEENSTESIHSPNERFCIHSVPSVINARGMLHKPPLSPALNSNCSRTFVGRRNSNVCRVQSFDKSSSGISTLDSSLDSKRPERPIHLSLSTAEPSESKSHVSCLSLTYVSSSASSCSLSDEDFRTASEASTPVAEGVIDESSHLWTKSEFVRGSDPSNGLLPNTGADLILPPSPPLNRTPISRVKERARSRVVKRSKTPPEEDLKSAKIDSLTKRVKELMAALASKESELLRQKSKESTSPTLFKKRCAVEFEPKSMVSSDEKTDENASVLKQKLGEEIHSPSITPKALIEATRFNECEDNSNQRRLSSSSAVIHSLPRMGSLSDLTNVDLDLDLSAMDPERLIEEWYSLRARFEKAVREIHALRKELRACQGHVDALELEGSAISMCLAEERKRAESDMQLMASRIQDLTVKLSASEKQVRQLKQKTLRVEMREKRRSLSLRSEGRSGTDPSLCSGKLPMEICDRLTQLEDTLASALGRPLHDLKVSLLGGGKNQASDAAINKTSLDELAKDADSKQDAVKEAENSIFSNSLSITSKEVGKEKLEGQTKFRSALSLDNTNAAGVQTSHSKSSANVHKEEIKEVLITERNEAGKSGIRMPKLEAKLLEGCSASEQKRIEGRRQRVNSRILRRSAYTSHSNINLGMGEEEQVEEEAKVEDDTSKKCDPLRILVRLSSLEGRVADFLKTAKNGNKMENTSVSEYSTNEDKNMLESQKIPENPCPRCENMQLAMDRMKEELMLVNNDGSVMLDRYREEIEQLRTLCEKGMRAMDASHQRLIKEMEEKHRDEINRVLVEKEQALREETKATLAALDAMRKAHETEVQREVAKFKEEFSRRMSAKQELSINHQAEMEGIRREILSLSQKYSSKCVECASLREQLRIARGMKDSLNDSGTYREVMSEHS